MTIASFWFPSTASNCDLSRFMKKMKSRMEEEEEEELAIRGMFHEQR
jgi:hypothetical protein